MSKNYCKLAWFVTIIIISAFITHPILASHNTSKPVKDGTINSEAVLSESSQNIELLNHLVARFKA